jgi:hypothetical protein
MSPPTLNSNGTIKSTTISIYVNATISPGVPVYNPSGPTYSIAIQKVMQHELGHTMGLADMPGSCGNQTAQGSVMNMFCGTNDAENNMPTTVTPCDASAAKAFSSTTGTGGTGPGGGSAAGPCWCPGTLQCVILRDLQHQHMPVVLCGRRPGMPGRCAGTLLRRLLRGMRGRRLDVRRQPNRDRYGRCRLPFHHRTQRGSIPRPAGTRPPSDELAGSLLPQWMAGPGSERRWANRRLHRAVRQRYAPTKNRSPERLPGPGGLRRPGQWRKRKRSHRPRRCGLQPPPRVD